jgi:cell division protein FtsI (penicillin-binding protein 3)
MKQPPPLHASADTTERGFKLRLGSLYICFVLIMGLVVVRLAQLQVIGKPELRQIAERQLQLTVKAAPFRLPIVDRNREELALSIPSSSVYARPRLVKNKSKTARVLAKALGETAEKWKAKLKSPRQFIWLQRQVSNESARILSQKKLSGIFIQAENKRVYPQGSIASTVLGFTDIDGYGLSGIEHKLNQELLLSQPEYSVLRDGRGTPSYLGSPGVQKAGSQSVRLTIDKKLQNALEEELAITQKETKARGVMGVIIDPSTGEILALAQSPSFDPNHANKFPIDVFNNQMISNLYEPGSTMKVLVAAASLEEKLFTPHTLIDCGEGKIKFGNKTIGEADEGHRFGLLPLSQVIAFSSNVGAVRISQKLGAEKFRQTLDRFGLTSKTGITLTGEVSSSPKKPDFWTPIHLATASFGQGISVTPLQMVLSYAPFANGGYWIAPKIVFKDGEEEKPIRRKVLSPEVAETMKNILISATEGKGATGLTAKVEGVKVAGKTGTGQKFDRDNGGYQSKKYFSSFIGFLPADKPKFLIGVMVDEPKDQYYANKVAAPLFSRIRQDH